MHSESLVLIVNNFGIEECAHTTLTHIFRVSNRCYDAILSVRQEVL